MADLGFVYLFRNPNRFLEKWKSSEDKYMCETKLVPYAPNYCYFFFIFDEIPKMKELGPENFFFIINQ